MLTADEVREFERDGYFNMQNTLTSDEVQSLSDALDVVIAKGPNGFLPDEPRPVLYRTLGGNDVNPVWQIVNIWEASDAFRELIFHPAIVRTISQLTGFPDLQVWHDQVQFKPASYGGATGWHQDAPLWPSISPMTPVSAWIPFDDATEENGCMWMVPGSHRWGNNIQYLGTQQHLKELADFKNVGEGFEPPADAPIREIKAVARPVLKGEVHFHHSLTWHGSPQNHSVRPRRAVAIHYMSSESVFTGVPHPMTQFLSLDIGGPMRDAGDHFPQVCLGGEPVAATAMRR